MSDYHVGHETYWGEIAVTEARQAAWDHWLQDYVVGAADGWIEQGATRDEVLDAAAAVYLDWWQINDEPWMPLGPALVTSMSAKLMSSAQFDDEDRVRYMCAQRTIKTAADDDRMMCVAYQLGIEPGSAEAMVERLNSEVDLEKVAGTRTALYRHFDANDVLIYIGITKSPRARAEQHRRDSAWFRFVANTEVEWYDDRSAALRAERAAIKAEGPVFNGTHNKAQRDASVAYLFDALARLNTQTSDRTSPAAGETPEAAARKGSQPAASDTDIPPVTEPGGATVGT